MKLYSVVLEECSYSVDSALAPLPRSISAGITRAASEQDAVRRALLGAGAHILFRPISYEASVVLIED